MQNENQMSKYKQIFDLVDLKYNEMQLQEKIQFFSEYNRYVPDDLFNPEWAGIPLDSILWKYYDNFPAYMSPSQVAKFFYDKIQFEFCTNYINSLDVSTEVKPRLNENPDYGRFVAGALVKVIAVEPVGTPILDIYGNVRDFWVSDMIEAGNKIYEIERVSWSKGLVKICLNDNYNLLYTFPCTHLELVD